MLAAQRRDLLLARLRTDGRLVAKDLARELAISEDSIRRDLRDLAAAGLCQRVYGGALPASPAIGDYAARTTISVPSKQSVAECAASLIRPGSTAIIDGGTTALAVARALSPDLRATVVTHSPVIAAALVEHTEVEVVIIGGRLFKHSAVTSGAAAAEAAERVHADLFLMGVTGVHPDAGLTTGDADEAAMKRILAGRAADTYVLASAEKLGAASRFTVLPLAEVAGIITDGGTTDGGTTDGDGHPTDGGAEPTDAAQATIRALTERGIPVLNTREWRRGS
jgi:DeoR/GlpR family transcriptional regulator of sugar metabolism